MAADIFSGVAVRGVRRIVAGNLVLKLIAGWEYRGWFGQAAFAVLGLKLEKHRPSFRKST